MDQLNLIKFNSELRFWFIWSCFKHRTFYNWKN